MSVPKLADGSPRRSRKHTRTKGAMADPITRGMVHFQRQWRARDRASTEPTVREWEAEAV